MQLAINALPLRERLIVKFAGICGMRPGEIIALQRGDQNGATLTVQRRMYRGEIDTPKTNNSYRTIALPQSIIGDLNAWCNKTPNANPEDWLFPSENPETPLWANTIFYDYIRPAWQKLGLALVNFQDLRRTAVTLLNQTGADGSIVASICGHTLDVSQNVHNQIGVERQRTAIQTLDDVITAA